MHSFDGDGGFVRTVDVHVHSDVGGGGGVVLVLDVL